MYLSITAFCEAEDFITMKPKADDKNAANTVNR
jgi:hypothetical protein